MALVLYNLKCFTIYKRVLKRIYLDMNYKLKLPKLYLSHSDISLLRYISLRYFTYKFTENLQKS